MKYPQLVSMPSAVSDWLQEQLEARGIDSEVYTRYILSLLHVHTLDVICPEEEEPFADLKKEGGRNAAFQKRLRRTSNRWRHAQADAEQIKRSAAVKCLMSASDQSCEIESLVDELCEKLKEVNAPTESPTVEPSGDKKNEKSKKISPRESAQRYYAAFPPLCPRSDRRNLLADKSTKKSGNKKRQKRHIHQNRMYSDNLKARTNPPRGRVSYKRELCPRSLHKEVFNNMTNWQFLNNNSNNNDQCLTQNAVIDNQDDVDMYYDLPVDISGLLNEPCSPTRPEELMNWANAMNTAKENRFLARGTNITSSIWSDDSNGHFLPIGTRGSWPDFGAQNQTNTLSERKSSVFDGLHSLPPDVPWNNSDIAPDLHENECLFDMLTISFMKVNHNRESSGFAEVKPCAKRPFSLFSNNTRLLSGSIAAGEFSRRDGPPNRHHEKDDLLTSEQSHFKPIKDPVDECDYADGATFVINGNLDKVDYGRSASGSMLFETEFGQRKFRHYRGEDDEERVENGALVGNSEFSLKYQVKQIDKACQTEEGPTVAPVPASESSRCFAATRTDSVGCLKNDSMEEVCWMYATKSCDKCTGGGGDDDDSDWARPLPNFDADVTDIWNGNKVCYACLKLNNGAPRNDQLRLETIRDGEQLMSDIRTIHNKNMEGAEPVLSRLRTVESPDQRKRRHSYMDNATDSWSFATRLQEDCFIRMSALPTLRSVTL